MSTTLERLQQPIIHGSPAGYAQGCRSAGECANHGSSELLTCSEADRAHRGDYALSKLPADQPIPRSVLQPPKAASTPRVVTSAKRPHRQPAPTQPAQGTTPAANTSPGKIHTIARPTLPTAANRTAPALRASRSRKPTPQPPAASAAPLPRPKPAARISPVATRTTAPPAPPTAPRERQPYEPVHGTVWGWRRGCHDASTCPNVTKGLPSCSQAHDDYYSSYRQRIRKGEGPTVTRHGTASGYQLGCHDRATCPGDEHGLTCPDASLAAERRRARERGIPPRRPTVSSEPARQHLEELRAAGMTLQEIIAATGVGRTALRTLIYGRDDYTPAGPGPRHHEIPKNIDREKACKVLAVPIPSSKSAR